MNYLRGLPMSGIPFVLSPSAVNETLVRSFTRAAAALVQTGGNTIKAADLVRDDPSALKIINRSAKSPTDTGATQFKQTTIAYMASILSGASAFGAILQRATRLEFNHAGALY
jgi:hypothetical protein